jgi:hypothetical protein
MLLPEQIRLPDAARTPQSGQIVRVEDHGDDSAARPSRSGWLVLAAFVAVLVAQGFRVAGGLADSVALLFVSIGLAAVAAILLMTAIWRGRRH